MYLKAEKKYFKIYVVIHVIAVDNGNCTGAWVSVVCQADPYNYIL